MLAVPQIGKMYRLLATLVVTVVELVDAIGRRSIEVEVEVLFWTLIVPSASMLEVEKQIIL